MSIKNAIFSAIRFVFILSPLLYANNSNAQTYQACVAGTNICTFTSISTFIGVNIQTMFVQLSMSTQMSSEAAKNKTCAQSKGVIDSDLAKCNYFVSKENLREEIRCQAQDDSSKSWSGSGGYVVLFLGFEYTLHDGSYTKCHNLVESITVQVKDSCKSSNVELANELRKKNNYQCAGFF